MKSLGTSSVFALKFFFKSMKNISKCSTIKNIQEQASENTFALRHTEQDLCKTVENQDFVTLFFWKITIL